MRLLLSAISALREGELRVRLDEERDALLTIKRGERPWPDVNAWAPAPAQRIRRGVCRNPIARTPGLRLGE